MYNTLRHSPRRHTAIDLPESDGLQGRESCEIRVAAIVPFDGAARL
jgi:hypothetical protein